MDFQQAFNKFSSLDFHPFHFKCLSECLKQHENCRKDVDLNVSLPRRLVDLGQPSANKPVFEPRLCLTQHIKDNQIHYVALSHSWSTLSESEKLSMITTDENQGGRCERIDLSGFPPNYQAAMIMCRSFGFQYLWLDSVCIVQDNHRDWDDESIRMRQIYGAATLTISLNTSQNLLTMERSKESTPEWDLLRHQSGTSRAWRQLFQKRVAESGIVGKRAWCLQERHLSPRLLHLLDNGVVIYECTQGTWSTNAPLLFDLHKNRDNTKPLPKLALARRLIEIPTQDASNIDILMTYWHQILIEYQNRALTFNEDNLTALAGITESMQARTDWIFLSGIWKHDIPRGILWECTAADGLSSSHRRFDRYHAPSWSWSSVDGSTKMAPEMINPFGEIVGVHLKHTKETIGDSFAHLSLISDVSVKTPFAERWGIKPLPEGSALELKAILMECQCTGEGVQRDLVAYEPGGSAIKARGTIQFDVPSEAHNVSVWCLPLVVKQLAGSLPGSDSGLSHFPSPKDCLGIGLRTIKGELALEDYRMEDLESEGADEEEAAHVFRRVGFVRLTLTDGAWRDYMSEAKLLRIE